MTSVDVAAIRARCEAAADARNTAAYNAQYGIGVGSSQYDRAAASARDVPALLSALGVAEARAQEAEATLERVRALLKQPTRYVGAWPSWTLHEIESALHGVPSQPQGDPT